MRGLILRVIAVVIEQPMEMHMRIHGRRTLRRILAALALAVISVIVDPRPTRAVEVGEPAPDYTLASKMGGE